MFGCSDLLSLGGKELEASWTQVLPAQEVLLEEGPVVASTLSLQRGQLALLLSLLPPPPSLGAALELRTSAFAKVPC